MENTPVINYTVPTLTPNVLVDQQGYAAVGEKQAVVKGRQPVETFRLVDRETGETVYEGTVKQTDYNGGAVSVHRNSGFHGLYRGR